MSRNKRVPRELQKYVVVQRIKSKDALKEHFQYFNSQREAKEWAKGKAGKCRLFKIIYDFYQEF